MINITPSNNYLPKYMNNASMMWSKILELERVVNEGLFLPGALHTRVEGPIERRLNTGNISGYLHVCGSNDQ